jgi:hypothetical protein
MHRASTFLRFRLSKLAVHSGTNYVPKEYFGEPLENPFKIWPLSTRINIGSRHGHLGR